MKAMKFGGFSAPTYQVDWPATVRFSDSILGLIACFRDTTTTLK